MARLQQINSQTGIYRFSGISAEKISESKLDFHYSTLNPLTYKYQPDGLSIAVLPDFSSWQNYNLGQLLTDNQYKY